MEQELLILPEHLSSPPVFSGVCVTRSLVLYVCFVDRCLSFCAFSFGYCVVCSSSIYGFWLPLWYLQTLLPFICSNIPAAPTCGKYASQLVRYPRACGSYRDFLERGLWLTRKLLNQGFLVVKLKSFLRKGFNDLVNRYGISDHRYVPFVVFTIWSFLHSWRISGFVRRVTRRVLHVEQELLTSTKHPSSHPVFSGIRVARSIVFCVVLYRLLFVLFSLVIWPLYCLSFDLQLLINPLVSSNFSLSVLGEGFIA